MLSLRGFFLQAVANALHPGPGAREECSHSGSVQRVCKQRSARATQGVFDSSSGWPFPSPGYRATVSPLGRASRLHESTWTRLRAAVLGVPAMGTVGGARSGRSDR